MSTKQGHNNFLPTKCPITFKEMAPTDTQSPWVSDMALPDNWQGSGTLTLAMAGARSSGKSLYIAVAIKLLKQLVIANGNVFRPADEYTRKIYQEKYETPLFRKMGVLPPTPPAIHQDAYQRRPLIFDIGIHTRGEHGEKQRIFLVIRDVAGEDLRDENFAHTQEELEFFKYADRIIFLFDPMAVSSIRELLSGMIDYKNENTDDPAMVLENVLHILGEHRPPIAMTLSKFDTMQQLANVQPAPGARGAVHSVDWQAVMSNFGASFRRESSGFSQPFDLGDSGLLTEEVKSLLYCLNATELLNKLVIPQVGREPYPCEYYVVSALGAAPEGEHINRAGIAPFRCLDPIRQLFASVGLFERRP